MIGACAHVLSRSLNPKESSNPIESELTYSRSIHLVSKEQQRAWLKIINGMKPSNNKMFVVVIVTSSFLFTFLVTGLIRFIPLLRSLFKHKPYFSRATTTSSDEDANAVSLLPACCFYHTIIIAMSQCHVRVQSSAECLLTTKSIIFFFSLLLSHFRLCVGAT